MLKQIFFAFLFSISASSFAQMPLSGFLSDDIFTEQPDTNEMVQDDLPVVEKLKYIKQPGLANAASKIYSADRNYSISGFLELNNVNYLGKTDPDVVDQDLELGYTGLYRLGLYFGYKFSDRWIFNSEVQAEFLHDGIRATDGEFNLEVMMDYLWKTELSFRFGNFPMPLGYVNVMEEPTAFFTVNRPEVERILIPTQWLEPGVMAYGKIFGTEYNIGVVKGLDATQFSEGAWIRPARYHWWENPQDLAGFLKFAYHDIKDLEVAAAGYYGTANRGHINPESGDRINTSVGMATTYIDYTIGNVSLFGLGMYGWLNGTDDIAMVQRHRIMDPLQPIPVLGSETYGGYAEIRWDILPILGKETDQKLPLFFRYERLNTHGAVGFVPLERSSPVNPSVPSELNETNITNLVFGINYRPARNIAIKANYTHRINESMYEKSNLQPSRLEFGLGIIF